jgi:hypothetical protein
MLTSDFLFKYGIILVNFVFIFMLSIYKKYYSDPPS